MTTADDLCRCGHERKWHAACSKCACPWFLTPGGPQSIVTRWRRDKKRRELTEVKP